MYDATQIQLPHRGSAFHDETGEALGGPQIPSPASLALGTSPSLRAFAQALSSAWNTLPATCLPQSGLLKVISLTGL